MRRHYRRIHSVFLLVRPRGDRTARFELREFKAHAFSPHHAEQLARAFAEKNYEVGQPS